MVPNLSSSVDGQQLGHGEGMVLCICRLTNGALCAHLLLAQPTSQQTVNRYWPCYVVQYIAVKVS